MRLPTTVKGRALAVDVANKHDGKLSYWDDRMGSAQERLGAVLAIEAEAAQDSRPLDLELYGSAYRLTHSKSNGEYIRALNDLTAAVARLAAEKAHD